MEGQFLTTFSIEELKKELRSCVKEAITLSKQDQLDFEKLNRQRLSRKQVKEIYNCSYSKLHQHMRSGELPYEKEGRKTLFKAGDVEKFFSDKRKRSSL